MSKFEIIAKSSQISVKSSINRLINTCYFLLEVCMAFSSEASIIKFKLNKNNNRVTIRRAGVTSG